MHLSTAGPGPRGLRSSLPGVSVRFYSYYYLHLALMCPHGGNPRPGHTPWRF